MSFDYDFDARQRCLCCCGFRCGRGCRGSRGQSQTGSQTSGNSTSR
ncbi:MAG: hypothetical protein GX304_03100 [Clostridiales bacterium]|nr:hypothetical protein [Clostridiales bacterium]